MFQLVCLLGLVDFLLILCALFIYTLFISSLSYTYLCDVHNNSIQFLHDSIINALHKSASDVLKFTKPYKGTQKNNSWME